MLNRKQVGEIRQFVQAGEAIAINWGNITDEAWLHKILALCDDWLRLEEENNLLRENSQCIYCGTLLANDDSDKEHWRTCEVHPARLENERLTTGIKAIAECQCLYRRDYFLLNKGTCAENGVFPGCVTCQARALLRKEEENDAQPTSRAC